MKFQDNSTRNKGVFIDYKTGFLSNLPFQWKVDLTYIQSRKNKFEILPPNREKLTWQY